uniref:Uncharacterized protein n=1 Tax=Sphaerodactylus townsendi TaxID=933632 RepID=A0ACB8ECJ2_9SAUR
MEHPPGSPEESLGTSFSGCDGTMSPGANSWLSSLAWLEQNVPDSPVLETLHQRLSALFQDKGTSITPVSTATAATWKTPPSRLEAGMNTSPGETTSTEGSNRETDSSLGYPSPSQLSGLTRPALEGCLQSAFVIIEAFSRHLRACPQLQRPAAHLAAEEQKNATTQTPGEDLDSSVMLGALHGSMQQSREIQQRLATQLAGTVEEMTGLAEGYAEYTKEGDRYARVAREDWSQMQLDYESQRSVLAKCQVVMKRMKEEVKTSQQERVQYQEICEGLKGQVASLRQEMDQVNQLAKTKACLESDLRSALQKAAAATENEQKLLLQKNDLLSQQLVAKEEFLREMEEQMTQISQAKDVVERERDTSRRELQELLDCHEFIEQENQACRSQLREVEEELKASRSALWERGTQLEDLKDAHQTLRQEQESLCRELATSKADFQRTQDSLEKFCEAMLEIQKVQAQFLELADSLREEAADSTQRSRTCTPARQARPSLGASFVDSILWAVAERDLGTPAIGSETSAFTKVATTALPKPEEVKERLVDSIRELQGVADQICHLTAQHQKAAQEEAQSLKAKISQLEHRRESLETQLKADQDVHVAEIAKMSKALNLHRQNEKELHAALCQQDERQQWLADQHREVMHLQEEVSQLKQALRKAETETAVLWEQLRGATASDVGWVQEKIHLSQEVRKLRELLLDKSSENEETELLQEQLYQTRQRLERYKQLAAVMRQVLTTFPTDAADVSELHHLLDLLE